MLKLETLFLCTNLLGNRPPGSWNDLESPASFGRFFSSDTHWEPPEQAIVMESINTALNLI